MVAECPSPSVCHGRRWDRLREELQAYPPRKGTQSAEALSRRRCFDPALLRNATAFGRPGVCTAGYLADFVLCAGVRYLRGDPVGVLQFLVLANALVPFAAPCLRQDGWALDAAEVYDNYHRAVHSLAEFLVPPEEESPGMFSKLFAEDAWRSRVVDNADEVLKKLKWRPGGHSKSLAAKFERGPATYSAAAPTSGLSSGSSCGSSPRSSTSKRGRPSPTRSGAFHNQPWETLPRPKYRTSAARMLSASGCVWIFENACIDERRIVLFADGESAERLPRQVLQCGEFGQYDFSDIEVRHPRAWSAYVRNSSLVRRNLLIVPGMMGGVSSENPFHLLHSTVPVTWQLRNPDYGLCIPRDEVDVRLSHINSHHARQSAHYWRSLTRKRDESDELADAREVSGDDHRDQRFRVAAMTRFWWGLIVDSPPAPLGSDYGPKCYDRVIFGRELFRTGLGGFVTPDVLDFYRNYLTEELARAKLRTPPSTQSDVDPHWTIFERLHPDAVLLGDGTEGDPMALNVLASQQNASFFDVVDVSFLSKRPFRLWKAVLDLNTHSASTANTQSAITASSGVTSSKVFRAPDQSGVVSTRLLRQESIQVAPDARQVNVLVVQRPKNRGRWIANLENVVDLIHGWRNDRALFSVLIADLEPLHPATQWFLATQAHILVGVTGAALGWLAFMRPGSVVLDLFPPGSASCTEGWGNNKVSHYGGLARLANVHHTCMEHPIQLQGPLPAGVDEEHQRRVEVRELLGGFWHGQNIRVDLPKFRQYFSEAVVKLLEQS
eukprot:TRINITY_DN38674_c0_g1_i1.p1 TRINITY_DN38674_c0_g1~~TRINITY_DN38674_c0_g1_i1.p1  ORF type:complete len:810 (-),score=66.03 TRINITY_DN38674_c0_g1_i1:252-2588(-)